MTSLSKSNAREVRNARLHLQLGNTGAYARSMSGLHRAASAPQQKLIWSEIVADEMENHFTRLHNGAVVHAITVAVEDDELTLLEMAA